MSVDIRALETLVGEVARFYIRDRKMRRAQDAMTARLEKKAAVSEREVAAYLAAVESYFGGFEREARSHLADVDRRLARVSQLQYNLTAERGVTARRVEVTQRVLDRLAECARP